MNIRKRYLLPLAFLPLFLSGCVEEQQPEPEIIAGLSYTPVKGLIPMKTVKVTPQVESGEPGNFSIHSVFFGERLWKGDMFSIDAATGEITVSAPVDVEEGEYVVSITCTVDGKNYIFKNVLSVTVIPGMPEVRIDPEHLNLRFEDLCSDSEASLPFVSIVPETEAAEITGLEVRNLRKDGEAVDNVSGLLSADAAQSIVSVLRSDDWALGTYVADLKVSTESFPEESEVGLLKDALKFTVAAMPVKMTYPDASDFYQNVGARYVPVFEDGVVPSDIAVKAVKLNGEEFAYGNMFAVDAQSGVITVTAAEDAPVGEYKVSLSYRYAGQDLASDDVLAVRCIAGLPEALTAAPQPSSIEIKSLDADSVEELPVYVLTAEGECSPIVSYSIADARLDGSTFDWNGRFTLEGDRISIHRVGWTVGEYALDIRCVTEAIGAESARGVFTDVVRISVFEKVELVYADAVKKEHAPWTVKPATPMPAGYTYSFKDASAAYASVLSINATTGEISAAKGNGLAQGSYTVAVTATAPGLESSDAEFTLEIVENPYYFTYFSYGNNLGLTEEQTRGASQFRVKSNDELNGSIYPVTESDFGSAEVSFTVTTSNSKAAVSVASDGTLTFSSTMTEMYGMAVVIVTAKTQDPDDSGNGFSVRIPVAIDFSADASTNVRYNPFLFRVNPKNGGCSVIPDVSGTALFDIDYRRNFNYFNLNGVDKDGKAFVDGAPTKASSFLSHIWDAFTETTGLNKVSGGSTANYGGKIPMSYYTGVKTNLKNEDQLAATPAYVNPNDRAVVVSPGLWMYNGGWADGVFVGEMTFTTDETAKINDGTKIIPVAIWLDPTFE